MIISIQHKACLFLVPRTGTTTIRNIFLGRDVIGSGSLQLLPHPNYNDVLPYIPELPTYQMFAFYRDPVERFISSFNYLKSRYAEYPDMGSFESLLGSRFYAVNGVRRGLFRPQTHWLDHNGITPLDFRQYKIRLRQVLNRFGVPPDTVIDSSNESTNLWNPTEAERSQITEMYMDDYTFFTSKGITFI